MTDKEIIQALECWIKNFDGKATDYITLCNALDLINRQQAELEEARIGVKSYKGKYESAVKTAKELQTLVDELRHEREVFLEDIHHSADQINEQIEEIERLNIRLRKERHQFADIGKMYSEIRAEAIKEFAERLKEDLGIWNFDFTYYADRAEARGYIDNLVKEMVGEDK